MRIHCPDLDTPMGCIREFILRLEHTPSCSGAKRCHGGYTVSCKVIQYERHSSGYWTEWLQPFQQKNNVSALLLYDLSSTSLHILLYKKRKNERKKSGEVERGREFCFFFYIHIKCFSSLLNFAIMGWSHNPCKVYRNHNTESFTNTFYFVCILHTFSTFLYIT